MTDLVSFLAAT